MKSTSTSKSRLLVCAMVDTTEGGGCGCGGLDSGVALMVVMVCCVWGWW